MYMVYQTAMTGVVATLAMTALLYFIHGRGLANADMIRAVGSLITHSEENAFTPGVVIHGISGVVFAFVYIAIWSLLPVASFQHYWLLGLFTGAAHGLVVSFMLVATVAEKHPLERFRRAGLGVAVAHLAAHVVYGLVIGLLAGLIQIRFAAFSGLLM